MSHPMSMSKQQIVDSIQEMPESGLSTSITAAAVTEALDVLAKEIGLGVTFSNTFETSL